MAEENKLEQETTGKNPNWAQKNLTPLIPFAFFNEEKLEYWGSSSRMGSLARGELNALISLSTILGPVLSIEYGEPRPWKWDEARRQQVEQTYQEHKEDAMKTLDKYDLNDDQTLGPEEFNRFYQEIRNAKYGDWKCMQDSYKSGEE